MFKRIHALKWLVLFVVLSFAFILFFCTITYIVDPFFQYRVKDDSYMLRGRYVSAGLVKNYNYDTLIIGSSMIQNFDMDLWREELGGSPLHIGIGGMNTNELEELLNLADQTGKPTKYYICIDLSNFSADAASKIPSFLIENSVFSKLRYSVCFESWFRFMPVDIAFSVLKATGIQLPEKYTYSMSIDLLENWSNDYVFNKNVVITNYKSNLYNVSSINTENLLANMIQNMDKFFKNLSVDYSTCSFFFPPYSCLYWCNAQILGYYDEYIEAKKYFIQQAQAYGCDVYDFQAEDITMNLDNYKDMTHYAPDINDWMCHCFKEKNDLVSIDKYGIYRDKMDENINRFKEQYKDLFR